MTELAAALAAVWTPASVAVALLAGFGLGFLVLGYLGGLPTYASEATPGEVLRVVALGGILSGLVFYVGQAAVDPIGFDRILSRFGLWCIYSVAMAIGTYARLVLDDRRHRHLVETTARSEVDARIREVAARPAREVRSARRRRIVDRKKGGGRG